jgi:hypothetical protein
MRKKKKSPVTSAAEATRIMLEAGKEIILPSHVYLGEKDSPFFYSAINEFSCSELTPHKIELCVFLARAMSKLEQEQRDLEKEGSVLKHKNGVLYPNPRNALVKTHIDKILSFRRSLGIHSKTDIRDVQSRRAIAKGYEATLDDFDDDGLIARPPKKH